MKSVCRLLAGIRSIVLVLLATAILLGAGCWIGASSTAFAAEPASAPAIVDRSSLQGKVLCGYQGWFRAAGDAAGEGWVHWSRDGRKVTPESLTFEMWPDMQEYGAAERFPVPGFSFPDGSQATLFSSVHAATVRRHFDWQKEYGIDGVWLQHFVVDLPGGPAEKRYRSRRMVLDHVVASAEATGRVWALTYDISGMPGDKLFETLTRDWKKLVDEGIVSGPRYLQEQGRPVVQIWGYYQNSPAHAITPEVAAKLFDFFQREGKYQAYLVGGGDWNWRRDPDWKALIGRFDAYAPWDVGNYSRDADGVKRAPFARWAADKAACDELGVMFLPVVYPGFSWDNLQRKPAGTTILPRRGGAFTWEQFHAAAELKAASIFVAMFDEVDEATAIFKVTNTPPREAHFVGYEGLPSDWYLRLVGEATRRLRAGEPIPRAIPIRP